MIFTTPFFILAGLVAALAPIAIHLLSKGKPKETIFPALQFIHARLASNKRKLTLKRVFLLALRVGLCLLLGLALARPYFAPKTAPRPTDPNEETTANGSLDARDGAIAAAIVLDSSLRMGRVKNNATLFETARATARAILEQTPQGSEIAVLSGEDDADAFLPDRLAARERLDKLQIVPNGRQASETAIEALELLSRSTLPNKELFIVSDATRASWPERSLSEFRRKYESARAKGAPKVYFVDLGGEPYRNSSIVDLSLSAESICASSPLRIDVEIERTGDVDADVAVELVVFDRDALPNDLRDDAIFAETNLDVRRETQTVSFSAGKARRSITFQTSSSTLGPCVGAVRIVGKDALAADDVRWFVVDVAPARPLLVVAREPIETRALYAIQALAPEELSKTGRAPFELDVVPYANGKKNASDDRALAPRDLQSATASDLERYGAILALDPPSFDQATVAKLSAFVNEGGGLGIFLGRAARLDAFQRPECVKLLGAKLSKVETTDWDREFAPASLDEPILAPFRQFGSNGVPWDAAPIARFWRLTDVAETASVVATFQKIEGAETASKENAPPALIENRSGRGLVATLATPISDGTQEKPWNELTSGDAVWTFVVLLDGIARRLTSSSSSILNYSLGEVATLRSPLKNFPAVATVLTPAGEQIANPTDVERRQIRVSCAKEPGLYRVKTTANRDGNAIDAAFAVCAQAEQFDMTRCDEEEWDKKWEGVDYKALDLQVAGAELETARKGKRPEPYAALIVALAALFLLETLVAGRFYKNK